MKRTLLILIVAVLLCSCINNMQPIHGLQQSPDPSNAQVEFYVWNEIGDFYITISEMRIMGIDGDGTVEFEKTDGGFIAMPTSVPISIGGGNLSVEPLFIAETVSGYHCSDRIDEFLNFGKPFLAIKYSIWRTIDGVLDTPDRWQYHTIELSFSNQQLPTPVTTNSFEAGVRYKFTIHCQEGLTGYPVVLDIALAE